MSKKKICLVLALILVVILIVFCLILFKPFKSMKEETNKVSIPQENTETSNIEKEEKIIENNPVMEEEIVQEEQQEVKKEEKKEINKNSPSTSKKENDSNTIKEQQPIIRENNDEPVEQEKIEKEETNEQNNSNIDIVDKVVEEQKDTEYETLLVQVQYATYEECMDIGFDEAIKDPVGILGFSCPYIAYKGKVIGYRLKLDYTNSMEN